MSSEENTINQNIPIQLMSQYKNIISINPKELGIRKKISIYITNDEEKIKMIILYINQKSRFLQKDVDKMEEITEIVKKNFKLNTMEKAILIKSPLCSKAKNKLELQEWIILS